MMVDKVINNNIKTHIINSNIVEYNIYKAYPTILASIDPERFGYLKSLTKDQYMHDIDELFINERDIRKIIENKTIDIYNQWLKYNKIIPSNFLATTTDSIIIMDQIAPIDVIDNTIKFRNKDKVSYTSLFYINKDTYILFDRITKKIKIQTKINDPYINEYPFVKKILKDLCCICNEFNYEHKMDYYKRLSKLRMNYIAADDKSIYGDILHKNEFKYNIEGHIVYTPNYDPTNDANLIIGDNYVNFVLPLIQSLF